jgi:hypothetical protein
VASVNITDTTIAVQPWAVVQRVTPTDTGVTVAVSPYVYGQGGGTASPLQRYILNAAQHPTYLLPVIPTAPSNSLLYVRGIRQQYGADYTIAGSVLTWVGSPLPVNPSMELFV